MTSRFGNRATGVAAATAIVLLVLLIVLLWTGVREDYFRSGDRMSSSSLRRNRVSSRPSTGNGTATAFDDDDMFATVSDSTSDDPPEGSPPPDDDEDEFVRRGQTPANQRPRTGAAREYVRPLKISNVGLNREDMLYARDQLHAVDGEPAVQFRHHSGNFRHRTANIWDPHPMYEFTAFQRDFLLILEHDTGFASPNLKVTHIWHNSSTRRLPTVRLDGCFYKGYVKGDPASSVTVSLCHGMTGNIRTSTGNYFIEPSEASPDHAKPIEHVIYETSKTGKDGKDLNHCGLDDHHESLKLHMRKVTSEARAKQRDAEMLFDYETGDRHHEHQHHFRSSGTGPGEEFGDPDQRTTKRKRTKRNLSDQYFVEMFVVADSSMANYHGNNTENYILALMYIVSGIFKDASIGNPITIAVVKLDILYDRSYVKQRYYDHDGVSAAEMLREFCHDQAQSNYDSDHVRHHDTALLLTRENICRNASAQKCETLGLAELGTMCDKRSSCSLVQDNGLSAAFTIAHELGHVFNMPHDDAEIKCRNHPSSDYVSHVMSTSLKEGTNPWSWSECSRHFITEFLESRRSSCLRNPPAEDIVKTRRPQGGFPGETIVGNKQCELLYGEGSRICSFMPVCSALWCNKIDSDGCQTLHMPWGDGTPCAEGAWCQKGVCVEKNRKALESVDGQWGEWQRYGPCSRTCGGGVQKSVRYCDNPRPQNGGSYCFGSRVRYRSCMTKDCRHRSDFRQEQCSAFDDNNHNIHGIPYNVKWVPKYGLLNDDRCVLYCRPEKGNLYYPLKDKVIDGTPCAPDSFDICVNGQCKPAGCDHVLYSSAKLDLCGKCNGSNDTCRLIRGTFNETTDIEGYRPVVVIPAGSSNLDIRQYGLHGVRDENYLSLRGGKSEVKLLNTDKILTTFAKTIDFLGVILQYSGCLTEVERINASRPLPNDLIVEVLSVGNLTPPNISYQYTVPYNFTMKYLWKHLDEWDACDRVCQGRRRQKIVCVTTVTNEVIDDRYCMNIKKPHPREEDCNRECTLEWLIVDRSPCSSSCGRGNRTVTRHCFKYYTYTQETHKVEDRACAHIPPPPEFEECDGPCSSVDWQYSNWTECSVTCGKGIRRRDAYCIDKVSRHYVEDERCDMSTRVTEEVCRVECGKWVVGNWSACSVTCGSGTKTRDLSCQCNNQSIDLNCCDASTRPPHEESCVLIKRCTFWAPSELSSCVGGTRKRGVVCKNLKDEIVPDSMCKESERPPDMYNREPCPSVPSVEDNVIPNRSIPRRNVKRKHPRWVVMSNGQCSVTCGTGFRELVVKCVIELQRGGSRNIDQSACFRHKKPNNTEVCYMDPCPQVRWDKGEWSECSRTCGRGTQQRQVSCRNIDTGNFLKDEDCKHLDPKPEMERKCRKPCPRYKWKYGEWSPCSQSCGYGEKTRKVTCMNVTIESNEVDRPWRSRTVVPDTFCRSKNRKKDKKKCRRKLCPYTWVEGEWSECSKTCGRGVQKRNVTCHQVNSYGWLDPTPLKNDSSCNATRPISVRNCSVSDCNSPFYWSPEEWQECSHQCGRKGTQRRAYKCRDRYGVLQDKSKCFGLNKPLPKSRPCNRRSCHKMSCKEVQVDTNARTDGEYPMFVGGKNMSIYCKGMNTGSPEEYLTVDYRDNYSEFIGKRLIDQPACHASRGTRTDNCECSLEKSYGRTTFEKVRLLVDTLHIRTDDFTFAQYDGRPIPLGEAGDCCCQETCSERPRGTFRINLTGTSLEVATSMGIWVARTPETKFQVIRSKGFEISGECGGSRRYGSCGSCGPSPSGRLKLHVVPP